MKYTTRYSSPSLNWLPNCWHRSGHSSGDQGNSRLSGRWVNWHRSISKTSVTTKLQSCLHAITHKGKESHRDFHSRKAVVVAGNNLHRRGCYSERREQQNRETRPHKTLRSSQLHLTTERLWQDNRSRDGENAQRVHAYFKSLHKMVRSSQCDGDKARTNTKKVQFTHPIYNLHEQSLKLTQTKNYSSNVE